jgi:hypothetical protein
MLLISVVCHESKEDAPLEQIPDMNWHFWVSDDTTPMTHEVCTKRLRVIIPDYENSQLKVYVDANTNSLFDIVEMGPSVLTGKNVSIPQPEHLRQPMKYVE